MAALLCTHKAHAIDTCRLSGDTNPTMVVHAVGTFEENMGNNEFLTDWINISQPNAWTCKRTGTSDNQKVILKPHMPPISPLAPHSLSVGGESYGIFTSGPFTIDHPNESRFGFIMTRRLCIDAKSGENWCTKWFPARADNIGGHHVTDHDLTLPDGDTYTVSFEYKIRLLKKPYTKDFPRAGEPIEFQAVHWQFYRPNGGLEPSRRTRIRVWFNQSDKTCNTPASAQTVRLPNAPITAFNTRNTVNPVGFTLELTGCSQKIKGIQYKLAPAPMLANSHNPTVLETTPWAGYTNGILPNIATTNPAKGVAIQVLDGNGNAVTFDRTTRQEITGYIPGSPRASIPLQAQYIKTGNAVTLGEVKASMTVLFMYQ